MCLQLSLWGIGSSSDIKLSGLDGVSFNLAEDEHFADRHLVGGQGSSLVRADDRGTSKGLYRWQATHNGILFGHTAGT